MPDRPRPDQPKQEPREAIEPDERPQVDADTDTPTGDAPADQADAAGEATASRHPRRPRILRPAEALDRLDAQWADPRPLKARNDLTGLVLTVPEHPLAFDYLGAMGVTGREVADACESWLDAQLAADALELGQLARPTVALVPAGRLWFVVRVVLDILTIIDGPGYLSPVAAVVAARRRYRALLQAPSEQAADPEEDLPAGVDEGRSAYDETAGTPG